MASILRKSISRIALRLCVLLLVAGCGTDRPTGTGGSSTEGVLKGRVVDSADPQTGLAGVTVRVEGTDLVAVTDGNGNFEFPAVESGDRAVVVDIPEGLDYQESRVEVSVHGGQTVDMDVAVLPGGFHPDRLDIEPRQWRAGVLESVHYYVSLGFDGPEWAGDPDIGVDGETSDAGGGTGDSTVVAGPDDDYPEPFRPTWTIRSETPIGVISREGIFIGTAVGGGTIVATFSNEMVATARIDVVADDEVSRICVTPLWPTTVESGSEIYVAASAITGAGSYIPANEIDWSVAPGALGSIEKAYDLSPDERAEILFGQWPVDDGVPMPGGGMVPDSPSPDMYSIARFHAADTPPDEGLRGEIRASAGDYTESAGVEVVPRGELLRAEIVPGEAQIETGDAALFVAAGFNRFDRPMGGLEYTWELVPADLGTLIDEDFWPDAPGDPDVFGGGDGGPGAPGGIGTAGTGPGDEPPPTGDGTGRPLPDGPIARLFLSERPGEGAVRVTVFDPVTGVSIDASARVIVLPSE